MCPVKNASLLHAKVVLVVKAILYASVLVVTKKNVLGGKYCAQVVFVTKRILSSNEHALFKGTDKRDQQAKDS